ncbi:hypothetical protein [Ciceribacter azotifigens]
MNGAKAWSLSTFFAADFASSSDFHVATSASLAPPSAAASALQPR